VQVCSNNDRSASNSSLLAFDSRFSPNGSTSSRGETSSRAPQEWSVVLSRMRLCYLLIIIVRDEWDNKKADIEDQLSEVLTVPWTVDVNPNQIYAYAGDGYAKESLGSCIAA
jgi:hypothetical protein